MSVELFYQPLVESVEVGGSTTDVITILQNSFGEFPIILDDEHIPTLENLAAGSPDPTPFEAIIEAITECGKIRLYYRPQLEDRT